MNNLKYILNPLIAKKLLAKGYRIVDLKQKKESPSETVFIFKIEGNFQKDLDLLLSK